MVMFRQYRILDKLPKRRFAVFQELLRSQNLGGAESSNGLNRRIRPP